MSFEFPNIAVIEKCLRELQADPGGFSLKEFLKRFPELAHPQQILLLLADQRFKWPTEQRRAIVDSLLELPEMASDEEVVADLIYGDWLLGNQATPPSIPDSLARRLPNLREKLARQLELHALLVNEGIEHAASFRTDVEPAAQPEGPERARSLPGQYGPQVDRAPSKNFYSRVILQRAVAGAGIALCVVMGMIFLRSPEPSSRSGNSMMAVDSAVHRTLPQWTLEVAREGASTEWESIASRPEAIATGELIRGRIHVSPARFAYVYFLDETGAASLIGDNANSVTQGVVEIPPVKVQSLPQADAMLYLLVLREHRLENPESAGLAFRFNSPLPKLPEGVLLVDGLPVSRGGAADGPHRVAPLNAEELELQKRLGPLVASRSVSPEEHSTTEPFATALKRWQSSLPEDLGEVHSLALPVTVPAR